jgi:hypothetical protein
MLDMGAETHAGLHVKIHYLNPILTKIGMSTDSTKIQKYQTS